MEVTVDKYNLYRFEDCNFGERGFFAYIPKNKDIYIMKLYVPDEHSYRSAEEISNERNQFIALFKAFFVKNSDETNVMSYGVMGSLPI